MPVHLSTVKSFRHRGLKRFFEQGDRRKLRADQADRIAVALADLDDAQTPQDLDLPGYRLHPLKGDRKGFWSIWISGNRRIIFRLEGGEAYDVELIDYH